jgi:hypothetical protein
VQHCYDIEGEDFQEKALRFPLSKGLLDMAYKQDCLPKSMYWRPYGVQTAGGHEVTKCMIRKG